MNPKKHKCSKKCVEYSFSLPYGKPITSKLVSEYDAFNRQRELYGEDLLHRIIDSPQGNVKIEGFWVHHEQSSI